MQTVMIGPIKYKIVQRDELVDGNDPLIGQIDNLSGEIRVMSGLAPQIERVALWHEIIHGILMGAGQKHSEGIVEAVSHGLVDFLNRNDCGFLLTGEEDG